MTLDERIARLKVRFEDDEDDEPLLSDEAERELRRIVAALRIEPTAVGLRSDGWPSVYVDRADDQLCLHIRPDGYVKLWALKKESE